MPIMELLVRFVCGFVALVLAGAAATSLMMATYYASVRTDPVAGFFWSVMAFVVFTGLGLGFGYSALRRPRRR